MTLDRSLFPDLTDEQWDSIKAEGDRRATSATKTATKNATTEAEAAAAVAQKAAIKEAVDAAKTKAEADEAGKLEIARKEIADSQAELASERKSLQATKKLAAAGLAEDVIEGMLPMFVRVDDSVLDATLDTFVKTYQDGIKTEVDTQRQKLLDNATPPSGPTDGPVDNTAAAQKLADAGDPIAAANALIEGQVPMVPGAPAPEPPAPVPPAPTD